MKSSPFPSGAVVALAAAFLSSSPLLAIPFNDKIEFAADLGSATELIRQSDPRVASFEEFESSLIPSDPSIQQEMRTGSLWFKWTAPATGTYFLAGLGNGDLLDVFRVAGGGPSAAIPVPEGDTVVEFSATGGEPLFFRHTGVGGPGHPFFGPPVPGGFILRKEGPGRVTDFGPRVGLAGYMTSFGESNSEKYQWSVPQGGNYTLWIRYFEDPEENPDVGVTLRKNGVEVPELEFNDQFDLVLAGGDSLEVTLTGDARLVAFGFAPEPPELADLDGATSSVVPSYPDLEAEWIWTAPADGYLRLESESLVGSELYIAVLDASDYQFSSSTPVGLDSKTLGFRSSMVKKVEAGTTYVFADLGGFSSSGFIEMDFFASPASLDDLLFAAAAEIAAETDAGLSAADGFLASALAIEPTNAHANAFRAFTRLALLESEPAYEALMQSLGVTDTVTDVFHWQHNLTEDSEGLPVFPAEANATERIAATRALISPRLAEIRGMLDAAVPSGGRRGYVAKLGQSYVVDEADILAIKASIDIVQALLDLLSVYDLGGSLNAIVQLERDGELDLEQALEEVPTLLQVANSAAIGEFKGRIANANALLCAALIKSAGQRDVAGGHLFPPVGLLSDGDELLEQMEGIEVLANALSGPVKIGKETVDLSQWNSSTASLRSLLPMIRGNRALGLTAPDPTLDGILPEADLGNFDGLLESHRALVDPAGFSLWIQEFLGEEVPPALARFFADADGDGDSNGEEYYFASDPSDPSVRVQSPVTSLDATPGGKRFRTSFVRRIGASDIRYKVAVSDDLKAWDYSEAQVAQVGSPVPVGDGEGEVVTVEIGEEVTNRKFVRIHAVAQ